MSLMLYHPCNKHCKSHVLEKVKMKHFASTNLQQFFNDILHGYDADGFFILAQRGQRLFVHLENVRLVFGPFPPPASRVGVLGVGVALPLPQRSEILRNLLTLLVINGDGDLCLWHQKEGEQRETEKTGRRQFIYACDMQLRKNYKLPWSSPRDPPSMLGCLAG